jgi:hypothetical protein
MGKMKELYLNEQQSISGSGDEDYIYEQYLANEKMNEEYWEWMTKQPVESIFPPDMEYDDEYYKSTYTPSIEEQLELDELLKKQNGHT